VNALIIPDPDHSAIEEWFVLMGHSANMGVLVLVHCYRAEGSSIRIISARRAGTKEQQPCWEKIHAKRIWLHSGLKLFKIELCIEYNRGFLAR